MKGASKAAATNPNYQPHVRIWNSSTLETLKMIGSGVFDRWVHSIMKLSLMGVVQSGPLDKRASPTEMYWELSNQGY